VCTVTWLRGVGRLELLTNRDEQRLRALALPPREHTSPSGTRYLAPVDPSGGGTWVAVNQHGLVLCLVNHYQARDPQHTDLISRGGVVTAAVEAADVVGAIGRARELPFERLRGFRLLVLAPDDDPQLLAWDGERVALARGDAVDLPLISSSVQAAEVERARRRTFAELEGEHGGRTSAMLAAFHASERPAPGPLAVCMSRTDAWTVSLTRVVVEPERCRIEYRAGRPSEPGEVVSVELARSGAGG
jgi:hypothetical protein